jgi:hypothetical protein
MMMMMSSVSSVGLYVQNPELVIYLIKMELNEQNLSQSSRHEACFLKAFPTFCVSSKRNSI